MSGRGRAVIARYDELNEHFEILVDPEAALNMRLGRRLSISDVLASEVIYKDAKKGLKASEEAVKQVFKTTDPYEIAKKIVMKGELQITSEQRHRLIEDKRRQIINFITCNCIDPRTGAPIPSTRVELALNQVKVSIDPFKSAEEQAANVIKAMKTILPLKMAQALIYVKIPPPYASKASSPLAKLGSISKQEWRPDGSLQAEVEIPAGLQTYFIDKVNKLARGQAEVKILRKG